MSLLTCSATMPESPLRIKRGMTQKPHSCPRQLSHRATEATERRLEGIPQDAGGVSDHVHLLIGLKATHRLADVLREMKSDSSQWVHEEIDKFIQDPGAPANRNFYLIEITKP